MIIGLHGKLQSGKDSTYERFVDLCRGLVKVERLSFADPLKDSAAALLGITREELELMKLEPNVSISVRVPLGPAPDVRYRTVSLTGREYLQRYGTESHRGVFGDSFWVDQAMAKTTDPNKVYVITDCRFENEASTIYAHGGRVVQVIGPNGAGDSHVSEIPLADEFIYDVIDNTVRDDDYQNLENEIERVLMPLVSVQEVMV